ncbi:MAG: pyrroline-5-carboxylate reductase [Candidatus Firestonebacteria bacterium RIFOXYC2_FULL_39_67]|nr:MAG: pyrroline-5-carboxylate reductase [Candidatus Firestonebacteria bacterium RIFOXYD2_FULL_39_29]OGF53620.1 MAG: pyrroline-5-carboxylate reductase [Candidatus Firestonebacteria bacterium RifOxyC12_full_39_7]OGF54076.1 MAG: pyrroline-5-carboxylate reductase [Candidatus Firestonebacteria bacterium RIFOXYC2_FULL_39_67]
MKIGFIGAGNMAEAIIAGLLKSKTAESSDILVSDLLRPRLAELEKKYGVVPAASNRAVISNCEAIIIAVKPKDADFVREALTVIKPASFVISIMAGITTGYFEKTDLKIPVIRVMPNTPALVLAGMAGICKGKNATKAHLEKAKLILSAVGKVIEVEEKLMDAVTSISGSGPAYVFLFAEALLEAAKKSGIDKAIAKILVANTLMGAAKMILESGEEPSILREKVTSPGGTTAAALEVFESMKFKEIVGKAVEAAEKRSKEMTK